MWVLGRETQQHPQKKTPCICRLSSVQKLSGILHADKRPSYIEIGHLYLKKLCLATQDIGARAHEWRGCMAQGQACRGTARTRVWEQGHRDKGMGERAFMQKFLILLYFHPRPPPIHKHF